MTERRSKTTPVQFVGALSSFVAARSRWLSREQSAWKQVKRTARPPTISKFLGSPAVAGDLVRVWIEVHQPDVAPEVAEHEDDLIGRRDRRSAWKVRGHHHFG